MAKSVTRSMGTTTCHIIEGYKTGHTKIIKNDPTKEQKLETLCDELLHAGIIKESNSLWKSPVLLATKSDGSIRFLVNGMPKQSHCTALTEYSRNFGSSRRAKADHI